jgi:diguanylate cyclase (GGDEF)-like protein
MEYMDLTLARQNLSLLVPQYDPVMFYTVHGHYGLLCGKAEKASYFTFKECVETKKITEFFPSDVWDELEQAFRHVFAFPTQFVEKTFLIPAFDAWFDARISSSLLKIDGDDALSMLLVNVTERERRLLEYRREADEDVQTSLYNRRYLNAVLMPRITERLSHGNPVFSIIVDIDHFKNINDTYGHQTGDAMLQKTAELLRYHFQAQDIVRYGGDEFILFVDGRQYQKSDVVEWAENMCGEARKRVCMCKGKPVVLTLSVGIGVSHPSLSYEELVDLSDRALYKAKAAGRNQVMLLEK